MARESISVYGITAATIEKAHNASFYGIYGNAPACGQARRSAREAVSAYLSDRKIMWNSFLIKDTTVINTEGTKLPYMAVITFEYD